MSDSTLTVCRNLLATCWTWAGEVGPGWKDERSPRPMKERLQAVADAGWQGIGLVDADLAEARATYGLPVLRRMIEDAGIRLVELEFLTEWWTSGERRARADRQRQLVFEAAAELGATTIKAGADHSPDPVGWDEFATAFDALATDAGSHGLRVALEPMPMNNIRTLQRGVELMRTVSNPHGGLCVDAWHVQRGGTDYDDLPAVVDIERVFVVELDDARKAILGSTITSDSNDWRLYPGEGELDISRFVAQMTRAGWSGHWGVEIISSAHRALPIAEGAARAHDATARTLDLAQELLDGR